MLVGEPKGMATYKGKDGTVLWSNNVSYGGPCMLHDDTIITDKYAYNLLTGEQKMRVDPLTGEEKPWIFKRNYGCNYAIASEHLLTFRSAAAGFYDLMRDGGTGNFGGFKTGCTSNMVVANGVLNVPEYTRTCSCSYPNQTSLALVHTPDFVEMWTTYFDEDKYAAIASSTIAIAFSDPEGNLTYVNNSFLKLWGYDSDSKVLGKSVTKFWQMENKASETAEALRDKGRWIGEMAAVKKDGSMLDVHLSASIVTDEAGKTFCVMASFSELRDIRKINQIATHNVPIKTVGINLGAPGDRRADNGMLWLEYPIVGGPSPKIPVSIEPENYERFSHHSSRIQVGAGSQLAHTWVVASGVEGLSSVTIRLAGKPDEDTAQTNDVKPIIEEPIQERLYTVRLYFSEPDEIKPGKRVFDIAIQGREVLVNFDIVKEAGGPNRPVVKEFKGIPVKKDLTVDFTPSNNAKTSVPLICGIEVMAEGW